MDVLLLTVFLSLILVAIFLVFYLKERGRRGFGSTEQDALLPFKDEDCHEPIIKPKPLPDSPNKD